MGKQIELIVAKASNSQSPEYTLQGGKDDGSGNGTAAAYVSVVGGVTVTPSGTQNVNLTQVNGNAQLAGAGVTGTGSERVTVAQDTTTIAGSAPGTAGIPSVNVVSVQGVASGTAVNTTLVGAPGQPLVPVGATNVQGNSGNVANAVATATMPSVATKTNYVTGFSITAAGATAAAVVTATLSGVVTTMSYTFVAPAGVTTAATPLVVEFTTPIPASAANTAISISLPALGTGNTNATVNIHGYYV